MKPSPALHVLGATVMTRRNSADDVRMYTEEDISSAIEAGVLTRETAAAFRAHVAQGKRAVSVDEEHFRLITGFNDIFVAIACVLVLGSVGWIIGAATDWWLGALSVAAAAWLLAEFFIRKRRMALPAIVLSLAFAGSILMGVIFQLDYYLGEYRYKYGLIKFIAGYTAAAIAGWVYWLRFRVPIIIALGTGAAVGGVICLLLAVIPEARNWIPAMVFAGGLVIFALALRWDATDTARQTRRSDIAFWLHLLAAPLLVHPVFASLGVFQGQMSIGQVAAAIMLYSVMALIALGIDRRALMVSALGYVLYALSTLLKQHGAVSLSFAIAALVIGSALLLISAFWHASRTHVLRLLPPSVQAHIPPLRCGPREDAAT